MAKTIKATGLDSILADLALDELRPDEFTAKMTYEKHTESGGLRSIASVRNHLHRMAQAGRLASRKVLLNGKIETAYSVK